MIRKLLFVVVVLTGVHLGAVGSAGDVLFVTNSATDTGDTPNVTKFGASGKTDDLRYRWDRQSHRFGL